MSSQSTKAQFAQADESLTHHIPDALENVDDKLNLTTSNGHISVNSEAVQASTPRRNRLSLSKSKRNNSSTLSNPSESTHNEPNSNELNLEDNVISKTNRLSLSQRKRSHYKTQDMESSDPNSESSQSFSGNTREPFTESDIRKTPSTAAEKLKAKRARENLRLNESNDSIFSQPAPKKAPMTSAEKMRASRAKQSEEKRKAELEKNRLRNSSTRAAESQEQTAARLEDQRIRQAEARMEESEEQTAARLELDRSQHAQARALESEEQTAARLEDQRIRQAEVRMEESQEQRDRRLELDRNAHAEARARILEENAVEKRAAHSSDILAGNMIVKELSETEDSIGSMNVICEHCGAYKFRAESAGMCCLQGKVQLPCFPEPPPALQELWHGDSHDAKLFRKHCRTINNAVCLTSMQVTERTFQGFSPSVIFQGRVTHRLGPLLPEPGEDPKFAQLYVLDPQLENTQRFARMTLPRDMSQYDKNTMKRILENVQQVIHEQNPFVADFKQILEIPEEELQNGKIVISADARPAEGHARVYNAQENLQELRIVTNEKPHDLVVQRRSGQLTIVNDLNSKALPLHFTLLFVDGTPGWDQMLRQTTGKRISPREWYAFHLMKRQTGSDYLFKAQRLFQEFILNGFTTMENQRLSYIRQNQQTLRADTYRNVREVVEQRRQEQQAEGGGDALYNRDVGGPIVGRVILPSTFTGSPRYYQAKFQDAMAIVRKYHKPTYFITMTCNPQWKEIINNLDEGQKPQDRPDLVARVFKLKKDQLLKDITKKGIFGNVVGFLWVIEWQKRGLPHMHLLVIISNNDIPRTPEQMDEVVVAELPPNPDEPGISDEEKERRKPLWDTVLGNMIHGPCGAQNPSCPCMQNGVCTKKYPKAFQDRTIVDESTSHPVYRRRSPDQGGLVGRKENFQFDNRSVVPYNPYLSSRFNCHINVEICISPLASKYLYKYVTKGPDHAMVGAEVDGPQNEVKEYQDLRSVGSSEAAWRLNKFDITHNEPTVNDLKIHLKDQQHVVFMEGREDNIAEQGRETELTAFFKLNQEEKDLRGDDFDPSSMPMYVDMPETYVYAAKKWKVRQRGFAIGRVHNVSPLAGDVVYLRLLLHNPHCKGKTSFEDLLTVNGVQLDSYQAVCRELGLLNDDQEWSLVLRDAAVTQMCSQIRSLFVMILLYCQPADPAQLFNTFWTDWTDDFSHRGQQRGLTFTDAQLRTMVRLDLQMRLQGDGKDLEFFGLEPMTDEERASVNGLVNTEEAVIREELDYVMDDLVANVADATSKFTPEQRQIFETVMDAVSSGDPLQIFISARGGCGKTFLLNSILDAVRSSEPGGCVALGMATTGIAAQLLSLGRTFHSRLKPDPDPKEDGTLNIAAQSGLAKLVQRAKLLMIDEATMLHRYYLEAMDRSLRDLMNEPNAPFGKKIIILAGDFRQCLPVVPGSNRAQVVQICLTNSHLWHHFQVFRLSQNMRVMASGNEELQRFDNWTLSIGDGTANDEMEVVDIPEEMFYQIYPNTPEDSKVEERNMKDFCNQIFPNMPENVSNEDWLKGRAILAPTNSEVDTINDIMESKVPGNSIKLSSADALEDSRDLMRISVEYLNTQNPNGFPKHQLNLKPGMPMMILRNISPKEGLCNGTKVIFDRCISNKLLVCRLMGTDKEVLIPRIKFITQPGSFPFEWSRRQFPVRTAFATTINKSQGQTLKRVGVWLRSPVFSHGQLYVASSRTGNPNSLLFAIKKQPQYSWMKTENPVYREVLID